MRLLITTDPIGGVWTFTAELTASLLSRGHAVSLVSLGGPLFADQQTSVQRQQTTHGDRFQFIASAAPLEWMQGNEQAFEQGEAVVHTAAAEFEPDILLSNQFCFGATTLPIPRVVAAHSDVLSWARAANPAALAATPWLNRYTALVQRGLLQANAVTAPTQSVAKGIKNSFFLPTNAIVIPNGRTLHPTGKDAGTTAAPVVERRLQAIVAGRLWDQAKGVGVLGELTLPLPVLLAGQTSHDGQTVPPLPGVDLLGQLSPADLQARYRESAIYLCTSVYEPFGLAPLEAALNGCALVCRDLPSLREVWGDSATYFTDAAGLQTVSAKLVTDPDALAEAQLLARRRASTYTAERMADAYLSVFASALAGHQVAANAT